MFANPAPIESLLRCSSEERWNGLPAALIEIMRQDAAFFEGHDPVLIYIAKRLRDALRLESILAGAGVDYGVETDDYRGGVIFQRLRTGAFFYVLPDAADRTRQVMAENGYRPLEPELEGN